MVVTRRGVWELEIAGEPRRADPMTATFWNRGAPYRVRHPVGGGDQCTLFRLTPAGTQLLHEATRAPASAARGTFGRRTSPLDGPGYLLHRRALAAARGPNGPADSMAIEEPALDLLQRLSSEPEPVTGNDLAPASRRRVHAARDIIARDYLRPLSVEGIAREVGCSPFHLSRLFRRATGLTLYGAVVRLRLREGFERLLDAGEMVSGIALDVGFASHSHFSDAFRAEYGCTPREARRLRPAPYRASTRRLL